MEYKQQIELKEVVANDEAIFFKVNVNGEDRIFVGQQNSKFDLAPEANVSSVEQSDKLSAKLKLAESFQKSYLVDKPVQYQENVKKDVIIPCAVSKEIVQLGNYLYSLSKETNNSVLYLLYKNRLINRYVDDKMHCIYYDIDLSNEKFKDLINSDASRILKGENDQAQHQYNYPGLISNFNLEELDYNESKGKYLVYPLEKTWVDPEAKEKELTEYKNMEGSIESLEDGVSVKSSLGTMPYNLIYEYGDERQFETDASNVYADFIHLKNSLSPFFNVEVEDDYKFRLWRKFQRFGTVNGNCLYTIYSLDTPKSISKTKSENAVQINVGNYDPSKIHSSGITYYTSAGSLAGNTIQPKVAYNLNNLGFSIHLDTMRRELVDRFMFSYSRRIRSDDNSSYAHMLYTPGEFFRWVIDNSDNLFYWKPTNDTGVYPTNTKFLVYNKDISSGELSTIECVETPTDKDGNYLNAITVDEVLNFEIPPFVEAFHFNYDSGEFSRDVYTKTTEDVENDDGTVTTKETLEPIYSPFAQEIYRVKEYQPDSSVPAGPIINWEKVNTEGGYEYDAFTLDYSEPGISTEKTSEIFPHKTVTENQESTEVFSDNWANKKHWTIKLVDDENQNIWIRRVLDSRADNYIAYTSEVDGKELKLDNTICDALFPSENDVMNNGIKPTIQIEDTETGEMVSSDQIAYHIVNVQEKLEDDYSLDTFNTLGQAQKIKFLLTKLYKNITINKDKTTSTKTYKDILNYQLCEANGNTTFTDVASALEYYANYKMYWKKGDKVRYTNYRVSPYKTTSRANDSEANTKFYYGSELTGQRINYFATPFELRKAISATNTSGKFVEKDPELTDLNSEVSVIDLFGLSIAGASVEDRTNLESQIAAFFNKNKTDIISVDLAVSLKDQRGNDQFKIETFINGQLVNSTEYATDDLNRAALIEAIGSIYEVRFWSYGQNKVVEETNESGETVYRVTYAAPFNYTDLSMWNYPISLSQSQQLRRKVLERNSLDKICSDVYAIISEVFTKVDSYDSAPITYGKCFNINYYMITYSYAYDRKDDTYMELQKLFKVQDFEFIDRIYGMNKLTGVKDRKSNLYSIRIKNSGFAITGDETEEELQFKNAVSSMLSAAVNTICEKVQPINTKLYSVIIES